MTAPGSPAGRGPCAALRKGRGRGCTLGVMARIVIGAVVCLALGLAGCGKEERRSPLARAAAECSHEEMSCPRPIFSVHDLKATARYYVDVLGFKLDWTYGDPPDFASVSRGHAVLFLCAGCQGQ